MPVVPYPAATQVTNPVAVSAANASLPEGWVDHPRTQVTWRWVMVGFGIFVLAIVTALASIHFRRTQIEKTTEFFGEPTIRALQLAPTVLLTIGPDAKQVDLSGTPGLGHLRHALLEQRHYLWDTREPLPVSQLSGDQVSFATLTFSDPRSTPDALETASVHLELTEGWVGPAERDDRVRLIDRAKPAVRHFLTVISNAQQARSDFRRD